MLDGLHSCGERRVIRVGGRWQNRAPAMRGVSPRFLYRNEVRAYSSRTMSWTKAIEDEDHESRAHLYLVQYVKALWSNEDLQVVPRPISVNMRAGKHAQPALAFNLKLDPAERAMKRLEPDYPGERVLVPARRREPQLLSRYHNSELIADLGSPHSAAP